MLVCALVAPLLVAQQPQRVSGRATGCFLGERFYSYQLPVMLYVKKDVPKLVSTLAAWGRREGLQGGDYEKLAAELIRLVELIQPIARTVTDDDGNFEFKFTGTSQEYVVFGYNRSEEGLSVAYTTIVPRTRQSIFLDFDTDTPAPKNCPVGPASRSN